MSWVRSKFNTLRPRQYGRHFADNIFRCIFLNENIWIPVKIVPYGLINSIPALVQIMAWRWSGDKPLSEPMMIGLLTHTCVTRPQWVKVTTWVQHPMDSHPFMSFHPVIRMIELFKYLTLKIQGPCQSSRSHNRYNIISAHIPFIPCWSALPFLRCSYLKRNGLENQGQGHGRQSYDVSLTSYRLTSRSFHVNLASHCWATTLPKFDLEIQGSRSLMRSRFKVTKWV